MAGKTNWFVDSAYRSIRPALEITRLIYRERSRFQKIEIFDSVAFGRILVLDGTLQVAEKDEFTYHEMMAHVPILSHGSVRRVLIIGGGDGGTLREVLKHPVNSVTLVEIDSSVIEASKRYLRGVCADAFADERVRLIVSDGSAFVANTRDTFDIILVDSTDRAGPARILYTEKFYRNCRRCLTKNGILVNQNGMPFLFPNHLKLTFQRRKKYFKFTSAYLVTVPSLYGGALAFGWATDAVRSQRVSDAAIRRRFNRAKLATMYYTPEIHRSSFAIPEFLQRYMS